MIFSYIRQFFQDIFFSEPKKFRVLLEEVSLYYQKEDGDFPLEKVFILLEYNSLLKNHLLDFKYHGKRENIFAYSPFFQQIHNVFIKEWIEFDIVVFPPATLLRRYIRGYNQSEVLAREFTKYHKIPVKNVFEKVKKTKKQSTLWKHERKINLKDSICIQPDFNKDISGKRVLFIDDIISTGSTAKLCGQLLKSAGAKSVSGLFLGRSE